MQYARVGSSGLSVSSIGLGTLTWGADTSHDDAGAQLDTFLDAGGTLLDTAASYGDGTAESIVGSLMGGTVDREDVVICTKAGIKRTPQGAAIDASRQTLLSTLDASLRRLDTDYVDLWLVHTFDPLAHMEETAHALEIAVNSGRARYVGVSNYPGWATAQIATALSPRPGLAATEVEYSLVQRGIEREVLPAAHALGMGVLAWSAQGRGVLTGKYRTAIPADSRAASEHLAGFVEPYQNSRSAAIVDALATAAEGLGCTPQEVALAWTLSQPGVSSAIVGARTAEQLAPAFRAPRLDLPAPIREALDDVSAVPWGYPERRP